MPMNLEAVGAVSEPGERSWDSKDALLYALGVGAGPARPDRVRARVHDRELDRERDRAEGAADVPGDRRHGRRPGMPSFGDINWAMLVHGEQEIEVFGPIPADGHRRVDHADRRHLRQGLRRARGDGDGVEVQGLRQARVQHPVRRVHPRRRRLRRQPRATSCPSRPKIPGARARPRGHLRARAPTRRCSTASPATATRCTPTRRSPSWPASRSRSCTACAPTASPAGRCCTRCADPTPRSSR